MKMNDSLFWKNIFEVAINASQCLGYLQQIYSITNKLLRLYKAYIRPNMEYNSHIWAFSTNWIASTKTCMPFDWRHILLRLALISCPQTECRCIELIFTDFTAIAFLISLLLFLYGILYGILSSARPG